MPQIEIIGGSWLIHDLQEAAGICQECDGTKELALTERAAYYPEQHPDELIPCPECDGTGKQQRPGSRRKERDRRCLSSR